MLSIRRFISINSRILVILIFFSVVYYLLSANNKAYLVSDRIQSAIKLSNEPPLLHVNGTIPYLGKARPIYIINLPSRSDRRTSSISLMQTLDLEAFIFPAYSISSPEILAQKNHKSFFVNLSELACWASHMRVWMTIANDPFLNQTNSSWSIIFEDDIDLEMDTINVMNSFPDYIWDSADLLYLGHCANPPGKIIYQSKTHRYRIHQALHPSCTHAYAIRINVAKNFIHLLSKPSRPVDNLIVKLANSKEINVFSIHPPLVIQKPVSKSNPSDINLIDRQSIIYYIKSWFYYLIQVWNGVEFYEKLNQSALEKANLKHALYWRSMHETGIWKNEV